MQKVALAGILCLLSGVASADATPENTPTPAAPQDVPVPVLARYENGHYVTGSKAGGVVAFTFDDGPDYTATPAILDALDHYGVKATFFVCGYRFGGKGKVALKNQAVLADLVARGHVVGNHTWNHLVLPQQKDDKLASEIDRNAKLIEKHVGYYPFLFRAPFGSISKRVTKALRARKIMHALWNVDGGDTRKPFKHDKVHKLAWKGLLKENGGILLLHDTHSWTAKAVPLILEDLENENCGRLARSEPLLEVVQLDHFYKPVDGERPADPPSVEENKVHWRKTLEAHCAEKLQKVTATAPGTETPK